MANPNIFAQYAQPLKSVGEYSNELARGDYLQGQNAIQRLSIQQATTAAEQQNASRNALQQIASGWNANTTPDQRVIALRNSGRPELMAQADVLEKQELDKRKVASEANGRDVETENKAILAWRDLIGSVSDPQMAAAYVRAMHADPRLQKSPIAQVPLEQALAQLQAEPFDTWRQKFALGAEEFVKRNTQTADNAANNATSRENNAATQATSVANNAANNARQAADNAASRGVQLKIADMADKRSGERLSFDKTEAAKPKAGAAGGLPNESERTAGFLLQRIRDSQRQLDAAVTENPGAAKPGVIQEGLRMVSEPLANTATGESRQRVESAQLDILDAALTLGTGAAYTKEQLQGYRKSYFPQLGDSDKAVADKQARLDNLIRAAETKAGRAAADTAPKAPTAAPVQTATNPKTGEKLQLVNGQWVPVK